MSGALLVDFAPFALVTGGLPPKGTFFEGKQLDKSRSAHRTNARSGSVRGRGPGVWDGLAE